MKSVNIIGITGGIGCGKSKLVQMMVESYNVLALDTDSIAKRLMEPGQISYKLIVENFGEGILNEDKTINSRKLSSIVMSDKKQLEILNMLTHPYVIKEVRNIASTKKDDYDAIVIESALLMDTPLKDICNEVWNISASKEKRMERLCKYRGYTKQQAEGIMNNQHTAEWYEKNSTKTFINNKENGDDMKYLLEISMIPYIN